MADFCSLPRLDRGQVAALCFRKIAQRRKTDADQDENQPDESRNSAPASERRVPIAGSNCTPHGQEHRLSPHLAANHLNNATLVHYADDCRRRSLIRVKGPFRKQ